MAQSAADPLVKVTIRLPDSLVKAAKHHCVDANEDLQDLIGRALVRELEAEAKSSSTKRGGRR
jgi:hypothetical protein